MYRLIILLLALFACPAWAADISITDCNETGLDRAVRQAVHAGSGTIFFDCPAGTVIPITHHKTFAGSRSKYVLDGNGRVALDGKGRSRILYTRPGDRLSLTVRNLTLKNGFAGSDPKNERARNQGGAVYSGYFNSLTLESVVFESNRARGEQKGYHGGGAVAIDSESTARVVNCRFTGNIAPSGGGINGLRTDLTIEGSIFESNTSSDRTKGGGGAIYNDGGKVTIVNSIIVDNKAATLGGGMFDWANKYPGAKHAGPTLIEGSVFAANEAPMGGAFWKGGNRMLFMNRSAIIANRARNIGGGIAATGPGPNFRITNSTISGNKVLKTGSGGGIYNGGGRSTIVNSTFAWNSVPNDGGSVGGAIHSGPQGLRLKNSIVAHNPGGWNKVRSCFGTIRNSGGNLQYPSRTCGARIPEIDPLLEPALTPPLSALLPGGHTPLHLLNEGSRAVERGRGCPPIDQWGKARGASDCDAGAYEAG